MTKWIFLTLGSVAGGFARFFVSSVTQKWGGLRFPWGTFLVNTLGCFLIGLFYSWGEKKGGVSPEIRLLVATGFCGAFTTFSSFIFETAQLFQGGDFLKGFLNITGSVSLGFLFFYAGAYLMR